MCWRQVELECFHFSIAAFQVVTTLEGEAVRKQVKQQVQYAMDPSLSTADFTAGAEMIDDGSIRYKNCRTDSPQAKHGMIHDPTTANALLKRS